MSKWQENFISLSPTYLTSHNSAVDKTESPPLWQLSRLTLVWKLWKKEASNLGWFDRVPKLHGAFTDTVMLVLPQQQSYPLAQLFPEPCFWLKCELSPYLHLPDFAALLILWLITLDSMSTRTALATRSGQWQTRQVNRWAGKQHRQERGKTRIES